MMIKSSIVFTVGDTVYKNYNKALKKAQALNETTFDFIEGVEVMTATLLAGNAVKVDKVGTLMKGDYIKK